MVNLGEDHNTFLCHSTLERVVEGGHLTEGLNIPAQNRLHNILQIFINNKETYYDSEGTCPPNKRPGEISQIKILTRTYKKTSHTT